MSGEKVAYFSWRYWHFRNNIWRYLEWFNNIIKLLRFRYEYLSVNQTFSGDKTFSGKLIFSALGTQASETDVLTINTSNEVGTRTLGSNAFNSTSFLTEHPSISQGSNISEDNSSGTVLQDLTITLDSNGHVTTKFRYSKFRYKILY